MFSILPNLITRLKVLLLTFLVADIEADVIAAAAERKAELLRQAQSFEKEQMPDIAVQIRAQAEGVALDRPLASVSAAVAHLQPPAAPASSEDQTPASASPPPVEASQPGSKKKKA
jgi:hypothetical protein